MAGGLMQLVAYGAQDVYLTGNPVITYFKIVYRRHTNFASEGMEIPIDIAKPNGNTSIQIQRNADLMSKVYLKVVLEDLLCTNSSTFNGTYAWVRRLGHAMIDNVNVTIGGSQIDEHYGIWLDVWYELTHTDSQQTGYAKMIGDVPELTTLQAAATGVSANGYTLFTPLQFWFCRNYGLALPLIALQYHDVRINIEFAQMNDLIVYTAGTLSDNAPKFNGFQFGTASLLIEYIYLDAEERRRFAQVGHEYLIEQLQLNEFNLQQNAVNQQYTLNANHPCKEMIFTHRCGAFNGVNDNSFLAYAVSDGCTCETSVWDEAVQDAAVRLARSMIVVSGDTVPSGASTGTITVTTSDVVFTNTSLISGTTLRFTVVDAPTSNTTISIITNALLLPGTSFNLTTLLGVVSYDLSFTTTSLTSVTVSVQGQTLSLNDLSIPIQNMTDNRTTGNAFGAAADFYVVQINNYGLTLDGKGNLVTQAYLNLNGQQRFAPQQGAYFNYVEPYNRHTHTPSDGINVYSFALHPEQHQPTGSLNASRIDSMILIYQVGDSLSAYRNGTFNIYTGTQVLVFFPNYNVLRVMSGMAGIAYSN